MPLCLPRLTADVSCGFTLVLDMSESFTFSNSKGRHSKVPPRPLNETLEGEGEGG